jgi:predicted metal-dependent hydrolase
VKERRSVTLSDGTELPYTLLRRKGMKHSYIYVRREGVEVRCSPAHPLESVEAFLRRKERWILRHLEEIRTRPEEPDRSRSLLYRGEALPLEREIDPTLRRPLLRLDESGRRALLRSPHDPGPEELREIHEAFYRRRAPEILLPRVEHWSRVTGLRPTGVSFRRNRSLWGSCSARDRLSLNTRLLLLPDPLIDYVVVHELCHIRHKNHSREFWNLVERYLPDWKERRKRLRKFEEPLR